jgi:hypothetical protein
MHCNDVPVLDTQIVSHNTIHAGTSIIKIVIGKNDQDSILPLLAFDEHGIASEQLEGVHCIVGESDD